MNKTLLWFYKLKFIQISLLIITLSCNHDEKTNKNLLSNDEYFEIEPDMDDVTDYSLSDYFNLDSVVFLETKPDYLIGEINGLVFKNDRIYILDGTQEQILSFSRKGKAIGKIKDLGRGPMEYTRISDFDIFDDKLYLSDPSYKTFLQYDANNLSPIKKINGQGTIHSFIMLDEDRLFGYSGNQFNSFTKINSEKNNNVFFRSFSSVEGSFLPFHSSHNGRTTTCGLARSRIIQYNNEYFYYNQPRLTAYKVHENGNISEYFKITGREPEFSEATMHYKEFKKHLFEKGAPSLLNSLNITDKFIYYHFSYNRSGYRGLFLKETGKNILFKMGVNDNYLGINIYMLPYKGKTHGLVGFLMPTDFDKSDRDNFIENSKIKEQLKNIKDDDNPVLAFFSLKKKFNVK
ncbi:MAG: 6-bladed beta-propeller [Cytophagales bacterium]|nr:6-bladed beta-propeller [Cytophagales bacterium]